MGHNSASACMRSIPPIFPIFSGEACFLPGGCTAYYSFVSIPRQEGGCTDESFPGCSVRGHPMMHMCNVLQRPPGGNNITTHHSMIAEVQNYQTHHWECDRCNDFVRRAMNRPTQARYCFG